MLSEETINGLDHGVRALVVWLDANGFHTTDSGDGSKFGKMEGALHTPHVFMVVDAKGAFAEADRLRALVNDDGWRVELTYNPADGVFLLGLYVRGVAGEDIPPDSVEQDLRKTNEGLRVWLGKALYYLSHDHVPGRDIEGEAGAFAAKMSRALWITPIEPDAADRVEIVWPAGEGP